MSTNKSGPQREVQIIGIQMIGTMIEHCKLNKTKSTTQPGGGHGPFTSMARARVELGSSEKQLRDLNPGPWGFMSGSLTTRSCGLHIIVIIIPIKGTNYDELDAINRFFGPFFIFAYFFMMTIFMMNFFMAILNDSFTDAREILEAEPTEDAEMSDFIGEYAKELLKEVAQELRGATGKRDKTYLPNSGNKETRERDYFLY